MSYLTKITAHLKNILSIISEKPGVIVIIYKIFLNASLLENIGLYHYFLVNIAYCLI